MGKGREWMYSTVETVGQTSSGFNQQGAGQAAIGRFTGMAIFQRGRSVRLVMYDLSSFSPAYPHARYGHATTLLTDNHLLLYGGCLR